MSQIFISIGRPSKTTIAADAIYQIDYGNDANGNMTSRNGSTISWTSYNLPSVVNGSGSNQSQFFYTPDRARFKQVANYAGTVETTIYVGGLLEKLTRGAITEYRHLIQAGEDHTVLYTRRTNGSTDLYHVTRDHLGSASAITNSAGTVLVNESFTAFGERRGSNWAGTPSAADWTQIANTTRRGFTDHEHLDNLNLIHMNGRVYDPGLGRFISADPFVDGSTSTQGYNRYSYVKNGPLRYTDPSGWASEEHMLLVGRIVRLDGGSGNTYGGFGSSSGGGRTVDQGGARSREGRASERSSEQETDNQGDESNDGDDASPCSTISGSGKRNVIRLPDFWELQINIAISNPWTGNLIGISGDVKIDRTGNLYGGFGPSVGRTLTFVSGSLTGNWLLQSTTPTGGELQSFLTGHSYNAGGGYWGGGNFTWSHDDGRTAIGVGIVTPQAGGGYEYGWEMGDNTHGCP